ncbi:uncharacterized protein Tco025E_07454 [Trypanosoma conorhini]|uniref:Mucin-like glycoprotein n=1 Tax=Trypanosoma conorhini TaxID=83891 RepID=A0A3R7NLL4_9TRYP|nr:uncharacterized protein Tco025E_07454 [Trypanosoma conorhini]RNF08266.1 hypothetical protein Tco025E_07454 [Trypanosoma conorhini]
MKAVRHVLFAVLALTLCCAAACMAASEAQQRMLKVSCKEDGTTLVRYEDETALTRCEEHAERDSCAFFEPMCQSLKKKFPDDTGRWTFSYYSNREDPEEEEEEMDLAPAGPGERAAVAPDASPREGDAEEVPPAGGAGADAAAVGARPQEAAVGTRSAGAAPDAAAAAQPGGQSEASQDAYSTRLEMALAAGERNVLNGTVTVTNDVTRKADDERRLEGAGQAAPNVVVRPWCGRR